MGGTVGEALGESRNGLRSAGSTLPQAVAVRRIVSREADSGEGRWRAERYFRAGRDAGDEITF